MRDTGPQSPPPGNGSDQIVIGAAANKYWLMQGEAHLSAMLAGTDPYPTPVLCVTFQTVEDFEALLNTENVTLESLWNINDAVIARLRRDDEIVDITPPPVA